MAGLSLVALLLALIVSCVSPINIGVVAMVLAWLLGVYVGGMRVEEVLAGFPVALFVTLAGVMLLFSQAQGNPGGFTPPADSPMYTQQGQSYEVKVDWNPGTYNYVCTPHAMMGMAGSVTVQ